MKTTLESLAFRCWRRWRWGLTSRGRQGGGKSIHKNASNWALRNQDRSSNMCECHKKTLESRETGRNNIPFEIQKYDITTFGKQLSISNKIALNVTTYSLVNPFQSTVAQRCNGHLFSSKSSSHWMFFPTLPTYSAKRVYQTLMFYHLQRIFLFNRIYFLSHEVSNSSQINFLFQEIVHNWTVSGEWYKLGRIHILFWHIVKQQSVKCQWKTQSSGL